MKKNPVIEARDASIAKQYLAGDTLAVLSARHDISRERVRQVLAEQGVHRRTQRQNATSTHQRLVNDHSVAINRAFDLSHSINQVVHQYKGIVPARIVREILAPRRLEQVHNRPTVKRFSDDAILDALRAAETTGATSVNTYRAWRAERSDIPSVALITVRFGSWTNARAAAGVTTRVAPTSSSRKFTDHDIDAALDRFLQACATRGVNPSALGYDNWAKTVGNLPTLSTVRARTNTTWSALMAKRRRRSAR